MSNFMSKFLKSSLLSSIGLAILGALLFFQSELTIVSIAYIIGAILIAIGTLALLKFFNNYNTETKNELDVVYGTVTIILGVIVINNPKGVASIIPFVLGILIVITSATKLQYALDLKKRKNELWKSTIIISILTLLCGVILVINPFAGAKFITKIVGIIIFIYAVLDVISTIRITKTVKEVINENQIEEKIVETNVVEAEVVEDNTNENKKEKKKRKLKKDKNNKKSEKENKEKE